MDNNEMQTDEGTTAAQEDVVRQALAQVLRQNISTSVMDVTLTYKIPEHLQTMYNELYGVLSNFSTSPDFKHEQFAIQSIAMRYRTLLALTTDDFAKRNADINIISPDQMIFMQNLTVLGGKLQSYNQLLATAENHAKIYDKLHEAAILSSLTDKDALEYLRRAKKSDTDNPKRTDIKELVTTNKSFESLIGIDNVINKIKQTLVNVDIGLVESFTFYIFYGIPGTGKTAMAEAIATQFSNGEYYKFDQSFFASTYLGVTESRIRNIFETVRANPTKRFTIVVDEGDNVMGVVPHQPHLNSVKILLQTEISSYNSFGPNLIIVCITNYLNRIDQTFRRRATDIQAIDPPPPGECMRFLMSQLTPGGLISWSQEYINKLKFNDDYVYTNSDMGRLAKNVRDSFLVNITPTDRKTVIEVFLPDKLVLIYASASPVDMYRPVGGLPTYGSHAITGFYNDAIRELATFLNSSNVKLQSFKKYFAPDIEVMQKALLSASSLTKEAAKIYVNV